MYLVLNKHQRWPDLAHPCNYTSDDSNDSNFNYYFIIVNTYSFIGA